MTILKSLLQLLQSFLCILCFVFCQSVAQPTQTTLELPSRGPHGGERAPRDSETPYVGENGPNEATGIMELKGPITAKEHTTVKGPTERKLKFFSYSRGCRHYLKLNYYGHIFKS